MTKYLFIFSTLLMAFSCQQNHSSKTEDKTAKELTVQDYKSKIDSRAKNLKEIFNLTNTFAEFLSFHRFNEGLAFWTFSATCVSLINSNTQTVLLA